MAVGALLFQQRVKIHLLLPMTLISSRVGCPISQLPGPFPEHLAFLYLVLVSVVASYLLLFCLSKAEIRRQFFPVFNVFGYLCNVNRRAPLSVV